MTGLDQGSLVLIGFGMLVVCVANLRRNPRWRFRTLFAASIAFVWMLGDSPVVFLPLVGFLLIGYLAVVLVRRGLPNSVAVAVVLLIAAYIWLKRYSFIPAGMFLGFNYLTLGLSYIFFRVLHVVIDAEHEGPARNIPFADYLAYTLNFTTFISGPIQRYEDFAAEIGRPLERPTLEIIGRQIERLIIGFFKVNVLATLFMMFQTDAIADLRVASALGVKIWAAIRVIGSYPFFLYCNFSGYIDIVLAMAMLMGLKLPENFDRPFSASSFIEFWSRWHITLSNWLKTYVYNPLLMTLMRRFPSPALEQSFGIFCFFVTFFLIGVWHGRTSEFIFFGVLQGGGVALNKLWQITMARILGRKKYRKIAGEEWYKDMARGLTFTWFAFSLVWFWGGWLRIDNLYAHAGASAVAGALVALWAGATVILAAWEAARGIVLDLSISGTKIAMHPYSRTVFVTALAAWAFLVTAVLTQPAPGIVYRTF